MKLSPLVALSFLLAVGSAMADDSIHGIQTKQDFIAMKAKFNKDLSDGTRYKELAPDDQKNVVATLDRMDARWQKADDVAHLSPDDRIAMANDQEAVAGILDHASVDSRVVCQRVELIGSKFPKNVCKTVAQMRREQDQAQDSMRQNGATTK